MPSIIQPEISNDKGVILTAGVIANGDRMAVVMPLATDASSLADTEICSDAVVSFLAAILPTWLGLMSSDSEVTFCSAEGMKDGKVPNRQDFAAGTYPGADAAGVLPNSCGMLVAYYEEPLDIIAPGRMRVAKTNFPGVSPTEFVDNRFTSGFISSYTQLGLLLQNGFASIGGGGATKWYRMLSAFKPRAGSGNVLRCTEPIARGYVGTQRRRLTPH